MRLQKQQIHQIQS